jgi:hypothetical protein
VVQPQRRVAHGRNGHDEEHAGDAGRLNALGEERAGASEIRRPRTTRRARIAVRYSLSPNAGSVIRYSRPENRSANFGKRARAISLETTARTEQGGAPGYIPTARCSGAYPRMPLNRVAAPGCCTRTPRAMTGVKEPGQRVGRTGLEPVT